MNEKVVVLATEVSLKGVLAALDRFVPIPGGFDDAMEVIRDHAGKWPQHAERVFERVEALWGSVGAQKARPVWDEGLAAAERVKRREEVEREALGVTIRRRRDLSGPVLELKAVEVREAAEAATQAAKPRPEWAGADWDKPVVPKPKSEAGSEARLVPPELGRLVARAEPRQPVSYFQYTRTPSGIVPCFENALIAVKAMKLDCRLDVFHDKVIVKGYESTANGDAAENLDNTLMKLRERILRQWGFDPGKEHLFDAVRTECLDHMFDPVRDYLDGLRWDGTARIDRWLMRYCSAKDTPVIRAFGRKFFVAGVRRVRQPGCKFDNILTMEGHQGAGKSTLLRTLAGEDNFCDNEILGLEKREQQEALQGVWIYELAELEGMRKADVTHIKLFASKTHDKARPAWGHTVVDRPRRTVFCATTNEDDYLRDPTGNRRWWPVAISRIDLDGVARDRDQLWAEAAFAEASARRSRSTKRSGATRWSSNARGKSTTLGKTSSRLGSRSADGRRRRMVGSSDAQATTAASSSGCRAHGSSRTCWGLQRTAKATPSQSASPR
jgi:Virulence-associated protein E